MITSIHFTTILVYTAHVSFYNYRWLFHLFAPQYRWTHDLRKASGSSFVAVQMARIGEAYLRAVIRADDDDSTLSNVVLFCDTFVYVVLKRMAAVRDFVCVKNKISRIKSRQPRQMFIFYESFSVCLLSIKIGSAVLV